MRVLITSGATREPIDDVRFISNRSTGKTGALIADVFIKAGFDVTFVAGEGSQLPGAPCRVVGFTNFDNLDNSLREILSEPEGFLAVIHLAAVSDYSVDYIEIAGQKLKAPLKLKTESGADLILKLKPNFKIVEQLKLYSAGPLKILMAFKLTATSESNLRQQKIAKLFDGGSVDYVVHNDVSEITPLSRHVFEIYHHRQLIQGGSTKSELADALVQIVRSHS